MHFRTTSFPVCDNRTSGPRGRTRDFPRVRRLRSCSADVEPRTRWRRRWRSVRHRHPAAAGVGAVPAAVLRQHRRPARPADDQRRGRDPGVRADRTRRSTSAWSASSRWCRWSRSACTAARSPTPWTAARWRSWRARGCGRSRWRWRCRRSRGNESVWLLYGCIAVQSGFYAVNNPARSAMVPRLLDKELMPAASRAEHGVVQPRLHRSARCSGALVIRWHGFGAAYAIDVVTFAAAYYALVRMPRMPPMDEQPARRAALGGRRAAVPAGARPTCG